MKKKRKRWVGGGSVWKKETEENGREELNGREGF
jgi:hypothetical protein